MGTEIFFGENEVLSSSGPIYILKASILPISYALKSSYSTDFNFDVTTIGKWLLKYHPPFREENEGSKIPMNYRLQSKRTTIKDRLKELTSFPLIEQVNKIKSERNDSFKDIYTFTELGYYVAWLIEAKYQQNQIVKIAAIKKIIEILEAYFRKYHSALSIVFTSFLTKWRNNLERDNSLIRNTGFVQFILPSPVRMLTNKNNMLMAISHNKILLKHFSMLSKN